MPLLLVLSTSVRCPKTQCLVLASDVTLAHDVSLWKNEEKWLMAWEDFRHIVNLAEKICSTGAAMLLNYASPRPRCIERTVFDSLVVRWRNFNQ